MTTRPTIGRPQAWPFPIPSQSRLANGVDVLAFDCPGQHVASVAVVLDTSLASEPTALEGVATLTQRTLDEGTRGLPGESFAAALEDIGGSLDGHVGQDHSVLFLTVPMSRLEPGLELMAESLLNPDFAEGDVERHRGLRLAELDRLASFPLNVPKSHSDGWCSTHPLARRDSRVDRKTRWAPSGARTWWPFTQGRIDRHRQPSLSLGPSQEIPRQSSTGT